MTEPPKPPRRGRPPAFRESPTALGRWLDEKGISTADLAAILQQVAADEGYHASRAPTASSIYDLRNARYVPNALVMHFIEIATKGAVTLKDWIPPHDFAPSSPIDL